jgi:nucleotide-binding universal stress UspA family protein
MSLPEIKKILYTTSLGPYTRSVYRHAIQMANKNNAELIMLHIITPIGELGDALIEQYLPADLVEKVRNEGVNNVITKMEERVQLFFDEELESLGGDLDIKVTPRVVKGIHDEEILRISDEECVDLIIMGTENKFGIHSQSHTTQKVIRKSNVPVYVVPTGKKFNK